MNLKKLLRPDKKVSESVPKTEKTAPDDSSAMPSSKNTSQSVFDVLYVDGEHPKGETAEALSTSDAITEEKTESQKQNKTHVVVTTTHTIQFGSRMGLRLYLINEQNKDEIKKLILENPEHDKIWVSKPIFLSETSVIKAEFVSFALYLNTHDVVFFSTDGYQSVLGMLDPIRKHVSKARLILTVFDGNDIVDNFIFRYDVEK